MAQYDTRFTITDRDGDERHIALIKGSYRNGKSKDATVPDIVDVARSVLVDRRGGRFVCADGRKPAVLTYHGHEVTGYRLAPEIAARLGIPAAGSR